MKAKTKVLHRCLALLLCIVMVVALMPETQVFALTLDTPQTRVSKSGSGLRVSWKPITGATKYRVFRMNPGTSTWTSLGLTSGTSYQDNNVSNGKTYKYTVRCVAKDGKTYISAHDAGYSFTYWKCDTPNPKVSVVTNGLKISWSAISGAEKYRVFRKSSSGWVRVGLTSGTSYVDESVASGNSYTYTVRCTTANGNSYTSDYNHSGVTGTFAIDFQITKLNCVVGGVEIKWQKISGVTSYTIERYTGQDWRDIGTSSSDSFTDVGADFHDGLASGTTYQYRVYYKVGATTKRTAIKSIAYYASPEIQDVTVDQNKFTVTWKAVPGVSLYRVFRRLSTTESWQRIAEVSGTSYTDTSVAAGLNYYYTVRCLSADGKSYISGHDMIGKKADYIGRPTLISTSVDNAGIVFKWNAVGGVTKYQVYRRTDSSSWEKYDSLQTVTGDVGTYTDTAATSGQKYYYTVACDDGSKQSDYDPNGLSCIKYSNPILKSLVVYTQGVEVSWYGVDGISRYRVFRKEASGTVWKQIGDCTGLTFVDKSVVNKGSYVYTVRCLAQNGNYASGYDTTGKSIQFFSAPTLVSAKVDTYVTSGNGTITVEWKPVEGVSTYSVYRRYLRSDGTYSSWVNLTHSASGFKYTDTPPSSGYRYNYTVRCSNGSKPISHFNTDGVSTYFLAAPEFGYFSKNTTTVVARWKYVDGALGYNLYRKVPGGNWMGIATIDSGNTLVYVDNYKIVRGQEYIYTVRAVHGNYMSGYRTAGISVTIPMS